MTPHSHHATGAGSEEVPDCPDRRELLRRGALAGTAALGAGFAACASSGASTTASDSAQTDRAAALDAAFAELTDQRPSASPIGEDERRARRKRLAALLAQSGAADALLLEGGATMTYLAGVSWGRSERFFGLVVTASGDHFWIVPAFEESHARQKIDGDGKPGGAIVAWQEHEYFQRPLAAELARRDIGRVAIEPALRHVFVERLAHEVGAERIASGHATVAALRGMKDAHEIELLRRANELTQRAIVAMSHRVRAGMTGAEISALMTRAHEKLGMREPWCLALIGPAAALPHGEQHDVALKRGDLLLVDTGASFHGYQSDNTRTWVFDAAPDADVLRVWNAVHDAQQRAFDVLKPGVVCGDVDRAARGLIDERGFGPGYRTFTHRLGHGIGLEGHEDPYFDGGSSVPLAPGMTLSNEPGIYLPGRYGVRLEDIVLCTESGADHFGTWQKTAGSPE
jgi:Xaa-Pro dipeptidase